MSDPRTPGWKSLPEADCNASEEVRFATVLNGGVSLAVWIGGVVNEIDAVTRREGAYGRILTALDARARVDIIAGSSAGGINGAALACTQVRGEQDGPPFGHLLGTWATHGALRSLVNSPGTAEPRSILAGDAVFLPRLQRAFHEMLPDLNVNQMYSPQDRPIQLRLTTTLLHPVLAKSHDSLGTAFIQEQHEGRFTFTRPWENCDKPDHFAPVSVLETDDAQRRAALPAALGLASRCTASFPVAFEPVYVPIGEDIPGDPPRPDMAMYANFPVSRWVVDGGVLINTPLPLVLDDIAAAPASLQTRRILLMVVPDPTNPDGFTDTPDSPEAPINVRESLVGVALSSLAKSIADDFDDLQRHNRSAQARRKARTDLVQSLTEAAQTNTLEQLAGGLFPTYQRIRMRRAATDLAVAAMATQAPDPHLAPQPDEAMVTDIHRQLWDYHQTTPQGVPFLPAASDDVRAVSATTWQWGLSPLERLADTVQDLQRRAIWVLPPTSSQASALRRDRAILHQWRAGLREAQHTQLAQWTQMSNTTPDNLAALLGSYQVAVPWAPDDDKRPPNSSVASGHQTARALCRLGAKAAEYVDFQVPAVAEMDSDSSDLWRLRALANVFAGLAGQNDTEQLLRLMALDVCLVSLSDVSEVAGEDVIELVQISTSVEHNFTSKPATERVAGLGLSHFAAFLKQSWRINDWIWGRLDGADRLITALLDPQRLRRRVLLNAAATGTPATQAANDLIRNILGLEEGADLGNCQELATALATETPTADQIANLRDQMENLRRRLMVERGETIVVEHEPDLAQAIAADIDDGANPDSTGKSWLRGYRERQVEKALT